MKCKRFVVVFMALFVGLLLGIVSHNFSAWPTGQINKFGRRVADQITKIKRVHFPADQESNAEEDIRLFSIFTPLTGKVLRVPGPRREGTGGATTSVGENIVLLDHAGDIFIIPPSLKIIKSRIAPPSNGFEDYLHDSRRPPYDRLTHSFETFRYNDIAFVRTGLNSGLAASYTKYHRQRGCYTTAISFLRINPDLYPIEQWAATSNQWEDIFETAPCLPLKPAWRAVEGHMAGGRIVFDGHNSLYLASGDYAWDGIYGPMSLTEGGLPMAQDPNTDYGKVIQININTRAVRRLSRGQRNMQGIAIDREDKVWTVEHGIRGGDELNRIDIDSNFGWPYESYGTQYSGLPIPSVLSNGRHKNFDQPIFAWLPSIAPSGLARVEGFHEAWDGDLLVATLKSKLVRLRIAGERVIFAEDIFVGRRIRHVHQHTTGEIVLWTDARELIFLRPSQGGFENEFIEYVLNEKMKLTRGQRDKVIRALDQCRECHSLRPGDNANAPSLAKIFDSPIASRDFAAYSASMKQYNGFWTKEKLVEFIRGPQQVIPGTTMPNPSLSDQEVIDGIAEFLKHLTYTIERTQQ